MDANEITLAKMLHDGTLGVAGIAVIASNVQATAGFLAAMCILGCAMVTLYTRIQQAKTSKVLRQEAEARLAWVQRDGVSHAAKVIIDTAVIAAKDLTDVKVAPAASVAIPMPE